MHIFTTKTDSVMCLVVSLPGTLCYADSIVQGNYPRPVLLLPNRLSLIIQNYYLPLLLDPLFLSPSPPFTRLFYEWQPCVSAGGTRMDKTGVGPAFEENPI